MDSKLIKIEDIKQEGECCFCSGKEDLFSLLEPYNFEENVEIYSTMIAECFQIELSSYIECDRNLYLICKNCVFRLRDAILLRSQIQIAYDRLRDVYRVKVDRGVISCEYSDAIDTKEHILKDDISDKDNIECDMNVTSGASSSNENVLKSQPPKIILEKNAGSKRKPQSRNLCTIQKHTGSRLNTNKACRFCNKTFKNNRNLLEHEKIHLDIKDYICDYCKRGFRNKSYLREHVLIHMGVKNKKCDLCDKFFVSKRTLSNHKRAFHSIKFSCNVCGKTLSSKSRLEYHTLSHSGVKNQNCEICNKIFVRRDSLLNHKRLLHSNANKNTCKYCNKTFTSNQRLLDHEKIHLDIKDFICDYCEKGFRRKASLQSHILLHMGIRNIKCDLCDKCFVSKKAHSTHKRMFHSMYLPCNVCGVNFKRKHKLTEHMKEHGLIGSSRVERGRPSDVQNNIEAKQHRRPTVRVPPNVRTDGVDHCALYDSKRQRCKLPKCAGFSNFKCSKCGVHLCLNKNKNCFLNFHH